MTPEQLDRAVARATGERLTEIVRRGFSLADPAQVAFDPEPEVRRDSGAEFDHAVD